MCLDPHGHTFVGRIRASLEVWGRDLSTGRAGWLSCDSKQRLNLPKFGLNEEIMVRDAKVEINWKKWASCIAVTSKDLARVRFGDVLRKHGFYIHGADTLY